MKYLILPVLYILALVGCSNPAVQEELTKVKAELKVSKANIEKLKSQFEEEGSLVHVVFFKLKQDADKDILIKEVKKLETIKVVKDLQVGFSENLEDPRALVEYGMMMEMSFDNVADYKTYQAHPIHLALKENVKEYLSGPPATYDYMKE